MATTDEFDAATLRMRNRRASTPLARAARFDASTGKIVVELNTGVEVHFRPAAAQGIAAATSAELSEIEISPSGLGLHFPAIDADIFIPSLLQGVLGSRAWAAALGRRGGVVASAAKAEAARENGRLGGRPRKAAKKASSGRSGRATR